jgi:L-lactate dehydrogenase
MTTTPLRYRAERLRAFARQMLVAGGLEPAMAGTVADTLVEGDLLGRTTHGLHLLAPYLADLESGAMARSGGPVVVNDLPSAVTWDGQRLPGPWLVHGAIDLAVGRARAHGVCAVVIRRSHHIGCLAAYVRRVTDEGLVLLLTCSDPTNAGVAPYGGCREVMTPNPIAAGWPTGGDPVVLDVSMSTTSNGTTHRLLNEGRRLPGAWGVTANGEITDDPRLIVANPAGALLPIGGADHGHKGFALGLLVEALTGGLAGHGRADPSEGWTATVFLQVMAPAMFGGQEAFQRETAWMADACRATPPCPGVERVRLPGEQGALLRESQLREGVELYPSIMPALMPWAEKLGVELPVGE